MEENRNKQWQKPDPFSGEKEVPLGTGTTGIAGAAAGGAVGGIGAVAAGASAGSAAGVIGAAVGAAIGAVLGTALERKVEHKANPAIKPGTVGDPAEPAPYHARIRHLSPDQQRDLLDLAVLASYADKHLADTEETALRRLLNSMGHQADWEIALRAAMSRNRPHISTAETAGEHAESLARSFKMPEEKQLALDVLEDVLSGGPGGPDERHIKSSVTQGLANN
jgi:hypothetical protein